MNDNRSGFGQKVTVFGDTFDRIVRLEVLVVSAMCFVREQNTSESEEWLREASELLHMETPALEQSDAVMGEAEFNPLTDKLSEAESNRVERAMTTPTAPVQDDDAEEQLAQLIEDRLFPIFGAGPYEALASEIMANRLSRQAGG